MIAGKRDAGRSICMRVARDELRQRPCMADQRTVRATVTTRVPESGSNQAASVGRRDGCAQRGIRTAARSGVYTAVAAAAAFAALTGGSAPPAAASQHREMAAGTRARGTNGGEDTPAGKIIGSPKTRVLFAKVHRAYLHVPAVEMTVIPRKSSLRFPRRFVLILRSGVVVAEEFTRPGRDGTTLVARRFHRTYSRKTGATCWRRLPASNPQTLADVGVPFPYTRVTIKALAPKRTAAGWKVASENRAEFWFLALQPNRPAHLLDRHHLPLKRFITYTIAATSHRLRYLYIQQPGNGPQNTWPTATLRVRALAKAPRLPATTPAC
jgi:hypothetical protein